jgi:uncharacterized protein
MRPVRIVVFAKAPIAGLAKTRLIPMLGASGAATLARRMLEHTLDEADRANVGPVELCGTPGRDGAAWKRVAMPAGICWTEQASGDLGRRLSSAARRLLTGADAAMFIGTDCPQLSAETLRDAARSLQDSDATMIPTADGGYALLGLRRYDARIFQGIAWSTSSVARETLQRLATLGWRVDVRAPLHDVDVAEDLRWVPEDWFEYIDV